MAHAFNFINIQTDTPFGKLTLIGPSTRRYRHTFFPCRCECGNEVDVNSNKLRTGLKTSCGCDQPLPSRRGGSRSVRDPSLRPGRLHKPTRSHYSSFAQGRAGFAASAEIDYSRPAYGSIPIDGGRFYWCAFRRLRDWLEGGSPLDSGTSMSELKAHDTARALMSPFLRKRELLAPLPESFVQAHYDRLTAEKLAKEAAKRWLERIEDDGSIAGYEWEALCEENDFDLIDLTADEDNSLQSIDMNEDVAA